MKHLKPIWEAGPRSRSPRRPVVVMSEPSGPPMDHLTQRSTPAPRPVSVALEPGFQAPRPARPLSSLPLRVFCTFFGNPNNKFLFLLFFLVHAKPAITDSTCSRTQFLDVIDRSGGCHDVGSPVGRSCRGRGLAGGASQTIPVMQATSQQWQ